MVCRRRRHQPRRPPLAKIRPGRPAPAASSVGAYAEAEESRGLGIDDQLELDRLRHREVRRLGALEDAADIRADLPERIVKVWPVAHEAADFAKLAFSPST